MAKKYNLTKDEINVLKQHVNLVSECIDHSDFQAMDKAIEMLSESVHNARKKQEMIKETDTVLFGKLNSIVESCLVDLITTDKKTLKKIMNTIKEDKNLKAEMAFVTAINSYSNVIKEFVQPSEIIEAATSEYLDKINLDTINESNKKLRDVLLENGVYSNGKHRDDDVKLYEAIHAYVTTPKTTNNLVDIAKAKKTICEFMENNNKETVNEGNLDKLSTISLLSEMTEDERNFFDKVIDGSTNERQGIFETLKNECLGLCETIKKDGGDDEDTMDMVDGLKGKIQEMVYEDNSAIHDITTLLGMKELLAAPVDD